MASVMSRRRTMSQGALSALRARRARGGTGGCCSASSRCWLHCRSRSSRCRRSFRRSIRARSRIRSPRSARRLRSPTRGSLFGNTVRFGVRGRACEPRARRAARRAARAGSTAGGAAVGPAVSRSVSDSAVSRARSAGCLLLQPHGYLQQLAGFDLGRFLFSFAGIAFTMTLSVFPVVYFSRYRARLMPRAGGSRKSRGYAAQRRGGRFVRITLPLAAPAIAASALLAFTMAIEEFGIPSALGARAGFNLLVTSIEARFSDWPIDLPGAAVLSTLLALTALAAFVAQRRLLAGRDFETQTGKPVGGPCRTRSASGTCRLCCCSRSALAARRWRRSARSSQRRSCARCRAA